MVQQVGCEIPGLNLGTASKTTELEYGRGWWNFLCSGEMRRYRKEHQWRRRPPGLILTLEVRKRGEQTGLDTLVVHAVNDVD